MKHLLRTLSVVMAMLLLSLPAMAATGLSVEGKDYEITNPYGSVDWATWKAYKTQLHCHTTASDGYLTVKEVVQKSYDLGYDIVAITDHGTLNQGWNKEPDLVNILRLVKYERTQMADIVPLTEEEYQGFLTGSAATTNGTTRQNGMLDVPLGIELNMATPVCDCHLTGYFSTYGQGFAGVYGDYETPSKGVREAGGISMLSHVGEYVYPDKDSADHVGEPIDEYFVNKFAKVFLDNKGSSVGMGINSATDAHTRCDRILYDQILMKTIPNGVTPWGFCFSDSHNEASLNDAYTYQLMPELTLDAFRKSMVKGTLFAVSHYSNGVELDGTPELPGYVEENVKPYTDVPPMVSSLSVNDTLDTISVVGTDYDTITWVSDGQVIERGGLDAMTLDLDDYDNIGCYVRFYLSGKGGICYSQPFSVKEAGTEYGEVYVPQTQDTSTALRTLVTVLDELFFQNSIIVRIFKYFALGY